MVNPGTFQGSQREFLLQQINGYIKAVEEGRAAEFIADVVRRYLKRYPLTLMHNVKPSPEHLAKVNDNTPDPEVTFPDEDTLSFEEYEKQVFQHKEDKKALKYRAEKIRRWLRYQYSKHRDMSAKDTGADNPWTILLHRLTGVRLSKPRKPQAFSLWSKANAADVDAAWQAKLESLKTKNKPMPASQCAASFQSFKSKMYRELSNEERKSWEDMATEEHEVASKEFEEKLNAPMSQDPEDLQACLERLPSIVKPLINMVMEATGCLVSVYVAGPKPADGGQLHIASFHGGKTLGSVKQTFVEAERDKFKRFILPIYANYLKKCFTVEMCREQALPADTPTLESIGFAAEADGVALHSIDGEMYNMAGEAESITTEPQVKRTAPSKSKKSLCEPPMKTMKKPVEKTTEPAEKTTKPMEKEPVEESARESGNSGEMGPGTPTPEPAGGSEPSGLGSANPGKPPLPPMGPRAAEPQINNNIDKVLNPLPADNAEQPGKQALPPNPAAVVLEIGAIEVDKRPSTPAPPSPGTTPPLTPTSNHDTPLERAEDGLDTRSPPLSPAISRAGSPGALQPRSPTDADSAASKMELPVTGKGKKREQAEEADQVEQKRRRKLKSGSDELVRERSGINKVQGKRKRAVEDSSDAKAKDLQPEKSKRIRTSANNSKANVLESDVANQSSTSPIDGAPPNLDLPKDAPKWAIGAVTLFQRESIPAQFLHLVERWIKFEVLENNWKHGGKFSATDRPKAVGDWINRARTDRFRLQPVKAGIDPVQEFSTKFWAWWSQLQPEFRQRDESDVTLAIDEEGYADRKSEGDWGSLRLPGMNGWVSIMAALCFWAWIVDGMSEEGYREKAAADWAREDWHKAVEDVNFVLGHLL